jgi:4-amino-4-deoxy-L-arabinose transferase-like glycosyltransferase
MQKLHQRYATALLAAALLLVSPMFHLLSASFMDHIPTATFLTAALWLGLRDRQRPSPANAAALGLAVGCACITRSLTALAVAGPLLLLWFAPQVKDWRRRWPFWLAALAGWLVPMAFLLYFNAKTNGDPFLLSYKVSNPTLHSLGFHGPNGHTPQAGLIDQLYNFHGLSHWLFEWPVTSFLFILLLFVVGRFSRRDAACLLPLIALHAAYFFYPYNGTGFTPRFVSESLPFLMLLTARGILESAAFLGRQFPRLSPAALRKGFALLLLALSLYGILAAHRMYADFTRDGRYGVAELERRLQPYYADPKATVFVNSRYEFCIVADNARCWGGAQFLRDPGEPGRKAYMARHPGRHYAFIRFHALRDLITGE